MPETATASVITPIGLVVLTATQDALISVRIRPQGGQASIPATHPLLTDAARQMHDWFAGKRTDFDIPLIALGSAEGESLRAGIASVAYGETLTYGALADRIGSVPRAVGQACKTNPYPIIIPCHRVVSSAGPEFYSGGAGPRTKSWLLDFEYDHLPADKRNRLL
jgi:methylated-DNA-[protein]-cysteine S-methyltransferase